MFSSTGLLSHTRSRKSALKLCRKELSARSLCWNRKPESASPPPPPYAVKTASAIAACFLTVLGAAYCVSSTSDAPPAQAAPTYLVNGNFEYPGRTSSLLKNDYTIVDPVRGKVLWPDWTWRPVTGWNFSKFAWLSNQTENFTANKGRCAKGVEIQEDITGNMYGELTASQSGTYIYQDIATTPDSVYKWSLKHASKDKNYNDKMAVMIGTTSSQSAQYATRTTRNTVETVIGAASRSTIISTRASNTGVRDHAKQWCTYTGAYYVPKGQTLTRFCFKNVASRNDTVGNLVDDISFTISYPLYYDTNGGNANIPSPTTNDYAGYYTSGTKVTLTSIVPIRAGYTFLGWSDAKLAAATNKAAYDANKAKALSKAIIPSSAKTVYAIWAKNPTITYVDGTGTTLKTQTVAPGGSGTTPAVPTRAGYTFASWSGNDKSIYADTTITATWNKNPLVIFIDEVTGEQVGETQEISYGGNAIAPVVPEHAHYTFASFSASLSNITKDTTIYIQYTPKDIALQVQLWDAKYNHAVTSKFAPDVSKISYRLYASENIIDKNGNISIASGTTITTGALDDNGQFFYTPVPEGKYAVEISAVPKTYLLPSFPYTFEVSFDAVDENHTCTARLPIRPQLSRRWGESCLSNGFSFSYPPSAATE